MAQNNYHELEKIPKNDNGYILFNMWTPDVDQSCFLFFEPYIAREQFYWDKYCWNCRSLLINSRIIAGIYEIEKLNVVFRFNEN